MDGRTFLPLGKSFRAASKEDNIAMFKFGCTSTAYYHWENSEINENVWTGID